MRLLAILAGLAACSASIPPATNSDAAHTGSDDGGPIIGNEGRYLRYGGSITSLGPVPFGGTPYCDYQVTLNTIEIDVVLLERRELARLVVGDTRIEEGINGCMLDTAPPNHQVFEHRGTATSVSGAAFTPTVVGHVENSPTTNLAISITAEDTPRATLTWHRTDQPAPLDWTVATPMPVSLAPRVCTVGAVSCIGALEGQLFVCNTDGKSLTADKPCEAGCAVDGTSCN